MKSGSSVTPQDTFDFLEFWRAIQRRRRVIWIVTGALFVLTALYCVVASRKYSSTGTIEVKGATPDSLGLDAALGVPDSAGPDSLLTNIEIQTQSEILQSNALALRVIGELQLEGSPDFKGTFNPIGPILSLFSPKGHPDAANAALKDRPIRRDSILAVFEKNLKVTPTPGTRLIEIVYLSKDPQTAKAVVNQLIFDLINSSSESRSAATSDSSKFMEDQLESIRARTERLQNQVASMQQQAGIVSLGTTDTTGKELAYSEILDELEQIGSTLGQAETNRILKAAVYDQVQRGNPELISGLSGNLTSAASPSISTALNMIQNLRIERTTEAAALGQMETKFGPNYPRLEESRTRIAKFDQEIHEEAQRVRDRAKNDYEIALKTEQDARAAYNKLKSKADFVNNSAAGYAIAKEEAESSRKLYEDLLSRSKEAQILQGVKPSPIAIVSAPMLPGKPARPKTILLLPASLFLGVTLGAGIALLLDLTDKRIVSLHAIPADFGQTPIGVLPELAPSELSQIGGGGASRLKLAVFQLPRSRYTEELRAIASSLFLSKASAPPQVITVTSPEGGEGKSTLSANLAVLLAQQGRRVVLVDANVRNPSVHTAFNLDNSSGLASLLNSQPADLRTAVSAVPSQPGLSALTLGTSSLLSPEALSLPAFAELLAGLRRYFECIVLDAGPVIGVSDAVTLAAQSDKVLLISSLGVTKSQALLDSISKLEHFVSADNLKLVINGAALDASAPATYHGDAK